MRRKKKKPENGNSRSSRFAATHLIREDGVLTRGTNSGERNLNVRRKSGRRRSSSRGVRYVTPVSSDEISL